MTGTVPTHGCWTQTYSGQALDLLEPQPSSICLADIALGLSHMPRFNGQTRQFYSVAQHSLLVAAILRAWGADEATQRMGLMHDATEAYLGDIARPVKRLLPEYKQLEARVWTAIAGRFELASELLGTVKAADDLALRAEAWHLLTVRVDDWAGPAVDAELPGTEARELLLAPLCVPQAAREAFIVQWDALGGCTCLC